ncbi:MAG TPA: sensor domain-containing diguanylate cyclase, partial [Clostridiales bacterium]|nr:sensor domain-containing diguanylate cyclase [Clostridiales bacterium]
MLLSIGSIGYMVFTNWYSSASRTTESIAEDLNERIYNQLYSFMHVPEHINEVNFRIIDNGILELSDESLRDKFFVGVLDSHDKEIYSFSYGTVDGEYYGASRNEEGVIEIVRSNSETGGNLWSYRVDDEMTA